MKCPRCGYPDVLHGSRGGCPEPLAGCAGFYAADDELHCDLKQALAAQGLPFTTENERRLREAVQGILGREGIDVVEGETIRERP